MTPDGRSESGSNRTPSPTFNLEARNEIARGYLLVGVFTLHGLGTMTGLITNPLNAPVSFALLKLLGPHVGMFFILSGISSRAIGKRSLHAVLQQSLMLILLTWVSESAGLVVENLLYGYYGSGLHFIKLLVKPLILGTGGCTFVSWFFTALAIVRIPAWFFERSKRQFSLVVAVMAVIVVVVVVVEHVLLHQTPADGTTFYEWPHWLIGLIFMLIGMKLPKNLIISRRLGLAALAVSTVLTWINNPHMFSTWPCLACHLGYISEADFGAWGSFPIFIAQELSFFGFILWASQHPPALLARVARYFGRSSLQFLLLDGWLLVTLGPLVWVHAGQHISFFVFAGLLVLTPVIHALAYELSKVPINKVVAWCFEMSRLLMTRNFWFELPYARHVAAGFERYVQRPQRASEKPGDSPSNA